MNNVYNFFGGRKIFWGMVFLAVMLTAPLYMDFSHYEAFLTESALLYLFMVGGNLGEHFIKNKYKNNENSL